MKCTVLGSVRKRSPQAVKSIMDPSQLVLTRTMFQVYVALTQVFEISPPVITYLITYVSRKATISILYLLLENIEKSK